MLTLEAVKQHPGVRRYLEIGNTFLGSIGAIEHNLEHAQLTSKLTAEILTMLGYSAREAELGAIAGYLHDIGNMINRYGHGMSGALMAMNILLDMGMDAGEVAIIMGAIGNHEEHAHGGTVNNVSAALILADKSDVNRQRVRKEDFAQFTARDRVNYAVTHSDLKINPQERTILMELAIDTDVCSVTEYFEIFLTKMLMCKHAANYLGCEFELVINGNRLL